MRNMWKMLILIVVALILCVSTFSACNGSVDPDEGQATINPTAGGDYENETTEPTKDQTSTDAEDDNSNIMDGNDHVEVPFG